MTSSTPRAAPVVGGGRDSDGWRRSAGGTGDPSLADVARNTWRFLVLLAIVGGVFGYGLSSRQHKIYSAAADIFLETPVTSGQAAAGFDAVRYTRNQADLINSSALRAEVRRLLGPKAYVRLRPRFNATPSEDSDLVHLSVSAATADGTVAVARAVNQGYQALNRSEVRAAREAAVLQRSALASQLDVLGDAGGGSSVQSQRDSVANELALVDGAIAVYDGQLARGAFGVRRYQPPPPPAAPSSPLPKRTAIMGALFAALGGLAAAYGRAILRPRAFYARHARGRLGVPMLARARGITTHPYHPEDDRVYESVLRLCLARMGGGTPAVGVTASARSSSVATGLAAAAARAGWRVTLVELGLGLRAREGGPAVRPGFRTLALAPSSSTGQLTDPLEEIIASSGALVVADLPGLLGDGTALEVAQRLSCLIVVVTPDTDLNDLDVLVERARFVGVEVIGFVYDDKRSHRTWSKLWRGARQPLPPARSLTRRRQSDEVGSGERDEADNHARAAEAMPSQSRPGGSSPSSM